MVKKHCKKRHSKKPRIGTCSYHLCDKKRDRLYRCKYCRDYFCHEHLYARIPQASPFRTTDIERHIEWEKKGGHPCFPYFEYMRKKEKEPKPILIPEISKPIAVTELKPEPELDEKSIDIGMEEEIDKKIDEEDTYPKRFDTPSFEPKKPKSKKSFSSKYYKLKRWFFRKKHPRSKLRYEKFGISLTILICSFFLFWIFYSNIEQLNALDFRIIELGSLVLLILFFVIIWASYRLLKNLRYGIRGLANGYKTIISIITILLCIHLFLNPNIVANSLTSFNYDTLNPFEIEWEFNDTNSINDNDGFYDWENDDFYNDNTQPEDETPSIEELQTGPKSVTLTYILHGQKYNMDYTIYQGLNDYLASLPRTISYYTVPPTTKDFIMRDLNQEQQIVYLSDLVNSIASITNNKDDQARIVISIVQNIPYDWAGFTTGELTGKFPYEVLYTQSGVCGEKSNLLVFLLQELGYGVCIYEYDNHRAVGIKCPMAYCYRNTGYCFVESTVPSIITDSEGEYVGVGKLSNHDLITISDGLSFDSVSEEYNDAIEYNNLNDKSIASGGILNEYEYNRWWELVNKYGINVG